MPQEQVADWPEEGWLTHGGASHYQFMLEPCWLYPSLSESDAHSNVAITILYHRSHQPFFFSVHISIQIQIQILHKWDCTSKQSRETHYVIPDNSCRIGDLNLDSYSSTQLKENRKQKTETENWKQKKKKIEIWVECAPANLSEWVNISNIYSALSRTCTFALYPCWVSNEHSCTLYSY